MFPRIDHVATLSTVAIAIVCSAGTPAPARAQQAEHRGEIEGVVRDAETGAPLAGASVTAAGLRQRATTGPDGSFHLTGIAPGTYTVAAERLGYRPALAQVSVGDQSAYVVIVLTATPLEIPGLVVTGTFNERRAGEPPSRGCRRG